MEQNKVLLTKADGDGLHPGFSIDCVIFGFHDNQLKVLLLQMKGAVKWSLPGGFVLKDEVVDDAANRVLEFRTGLKNVFLHQFHLFSDPKRNDLAFNKKILKMHQVSPDPDHWFLQRYISMGYYALVEFSKAIPRADYLSNACQWWDMKNLPETVLDHGQILEKALAHLRRELSYQPIGYNLLSDKFTMPELQSLYETILDKKLDRRNFQRKMLAFDILKRHEERKSGVAHKAPFLYSFELDKYNKALNEGLSGTW